MDNPFDILGLTPRLVNLLRSRPALLRKIAQNNRKYLQAVLHPDISGGDEASKELNAALDLLEDDEAVRSFADLYVSQQQVSGEGVKERILRGDLKTCEREIWSLKNVLEKEREGSRRLQALIAEHGRALAFSLRKSDLKAFHNPVLGFTGDLIELAPVRYKLTVTESTGQAVYSLDGTDRSCLLSMTNRLTVETDAGVKKAKIIGAFVKLEPFSDITISAGSNWQEVMNKLGGIIPFLRLKSPVILAESDSRRRHIMLRSIGTLMSIEAVPKVSGAHRQGAKAVAAKRRETKKTLMGEEISEKTILPTARSRKSRQGS